MPLIAFHTPLFRHQRLTFELWVAQGDKIGNWPHKPPQKKIKGSSLLTRKLPPLTILQGVLLDGPFTVFESWSEYARFVSLRFLKDLKYTNWKGRRRGEGSQACLKKGTHSTWYNLHGEKSITFNGINLHYTMGPNTVKFLSIEMDRTEYYLMDKWIFEGKRRKKKKTFAHAYCKLLTSHRPDWTALWMHRNITYTVNIMIKMLPGDSEIYKEEENAPPGDYFWHRARHFSDPLSACWNNVACFLRHQMALTTNNEHIKFGAALQISKGKVV